MTYNAGNGVHTTDLYQARNKCRLVRSTGTDSTLPSLRRNQIRTGLEVPAEILQHNSNTAEETIRTRVKPRGILSIHVPLTAN